MMMILTFIIIRLNTWLLMRVTTQSIHIVFYVLPEHYMLFLCFFNTAIFKQEMLKFLSKHA